MPTIRDHVASTFRTLNDHEVNLIAMFFNEDLELFFDAFDRVREVSPAEWSPDSLVRRLLEGVRFTLTAQFCNMVGLPEILSRRGGSGNG